MPCHNHITALVTLQSFSHSHPSIHCFESDNETALNGQRYSGTGHETRETRHDNTMMMIKLGRKWWKDDPLTKQRTKGEKLFIPILILAFVLVISASVVLTTQAKGPYTKPLGETGPPTLDDILFFGLVSNPRAMTVRIISPFYSLQATRRDGLNLAGAGADNTCLGLVSNWIGSCRFDHLQDLVGHGQVFRLLRDDQSTQSRGFRSYRYGTQCVRRVP